MPVIRRRIYDTVLDPLGNPLVGLEVAVRLVDAAFYRPDPSVSIQPIEMTTKTDANGYWSFDLIPNALLAPRGNYYILRVGKKFYYLWIPADDTTPLPLSAVLIGEHDICQADLPGVTGVRVYGQPPLTGVVTLKSGVETTLEQDYDNRIITIHGRKYLEGTEITIEPVDPLTYRLHGRRIVGEQGIIVTPRLPFDRVVTPDYGIEVRPIAAASSAGTLNRFARVDHTHEGVHALDAMTGDITIEAPLGLWKVDDTINKKIILKNPIPMVLTPDDFRPYGAINKDFFPWQTNENVAFTAQDSLENDVTTILTDNDTTTFVAATEFPAPEPANIIFLQWVTRSIYKIRFYVSSVRQQGPIRVTVEDYANNTLVSNEVFVSGVGWYEVLLRTPPHAVKATIAAVPLTDPYGNIISNTYVDIAEVRLDGGIAIPALYTGVRWGTDIGYSEGIIQSICFLYAGGQYRYRAWFGSTGDAATAIVEGRLYDETGLVAIFRPQGGLGTGTQDQLFVLSGDLITPTQSKFFLIEWFLASDVRSGMGGAPHFLGMLIESA
jgi:hypothetical protein